MWDSALYVGAVMHRRLRPRTHHFRYRAFWMLIDLDKLPRLPAALRLFSHNRANLFSFHDRDHGDGSGTPLKAQIERLLAARGIAIPGGRVQLLCMPRTFGYSFNPLSIYFCYDRAGSLVALAHQVHNTFGERHTYVLPIARRDQAVHQSCGKDFYVSPFIGMGMRYRFRVLAPGDHISVGIRVGDAAAPVLNAALSGTRRELSDRNLWRLAWSIPAVTLKVTAAIHWEALRLWIKGLRFQPRPVADGRIADPRPTVTVD